MFMLCDFGVCRFSTSRLMRILKGDGSCLRNRNLMVRFLFESAMSLLAFFFALNCVLYWILYCFILI